MMQQPAQVKDYQLSSNAVSGAVGQLVRNYQAPAGITERKPMMSSSIKTMRELVNYFASMGVFGPRGRQEAAVSAATYQGASFYNQNYDTTPREGLAETVREAIAHMPQNPVNLQSRPASNDETRASKSYSRNILYDLYAAAKSRAKGAYDKTKRDIPSQSEIFGKLRQGKVYNSMRSLVSAVKENFE